MGRDPQSNGALHLIPHYRIAGQISFDPVELDRWVRKHRIDEFTASVRKLS
jgi:hypothetical protein